MSEQMSLGGILDGSPPPAPEPAPAVEPAAPEPQAAETAPAPVAKEAIPATEERPRGPDGKFLPKEAAPVAETQPPPKPAAPQQEQLTPRERAAIAQAMDERRKRQEFERRLKELESTKPVEPPKAFWDDPEGALKNFEQRIEGVAVTTKLNTAETIARSKHQDFDEKVAVFADVLGKTPGLHQQWLNSPDPAEFAYQLGKNHLELQQVGSMDAMRAQIEKETRLKVEAEFKAKAEAEAKQRAAIPGSLSQARGVGGSNTPVWDGPPSLDSVLGKA